MLLDLSSYSLSDVTVISVCYHSDMVIGDMIASVPTVTPIILVDNGCTNKFDQLPQDRTVSIIKMVENQGFGRGCNAGAQLAKTSLLMFLNPDARLSDGALQALVDAANQYPSASAFNPRIVNSDGSAYFKRRSYLLPRRAWMKRGWPPKDCEVPVLSGAALMVSKRYFHAAQGFDKEIFLYHEDDDLSLRLREFGTLVYVQKSEVIHAGGHSSGRSANVAYLKALHMAQSRVYTGRKYGRPFPALTTFFRAVLLLGSPVNLVSSRRRAKALGMMVGSAMMLRSSWQKKTMSKT